MPSTTMPIWLTWITPQALIDDSIWRISTIWWAFVLAVHPSPTEMAWWTSKTSGEPAKDSRCSGLTARVFPGRAVRKLIFHTSSDETIAQLRFRFNQSHQASLTLKVLLWTIFEAWLIREEGFFTEWKQGNTPTKKHTNPAFGGVFYWHRWR